MKYLLFALLALLSAFPATAQYTRQDTLRGSNGRGRDWWDVQKYDLTIVIDSATKRIFGTNTITFRITRDPGADSMQIDLQEGMEMHVEWTDHVYTGLKSEGNMFWLVNPKGFGKIGDTASLTLKFTGKPRCRQPTMGWRIYLGKGQHR